MDKKGGVWISKINENASIVRQQELYHQRSPALPDDKSEELSSTRIKRVQRGIVAVGNSSWEQFYFAAKKQTTQTAKKRIFMTFFWEQIIELLMVRATKHFRKCWTTTNKTILTTSCCATFFFQKSTWTTITAFFNKQASWICTCLTLFFFWVRLIYWYYSVLRVKTKIKLILSDHAVCEKDVYRN